MAIVSNTFQTSSAVGNREELSDVVSRITPEDTPIYSMVPKTRASSIHPEWEIDDLASPAANATLEGDEFAFDATSPPTRVGNYTQIFRKEWIISNTQEAVDNAGQVEKSKYQKLKKGVEIRKDLEFAIVSNTATVAGTTRYFGSLPSWLETNVARNGAGANGGYQSDGLTDAEGLGTLRAFTKALFDGVLQSVYNSGGTPRYAVLSPYNKTVFTSFMSDNNVASFRYAASANGRNTIIATADVYEGDFGKTMVVPNRVMAGAAAIARRAYVLDPSLLEMKMLRPIQNVKNLANTSDATRGVIIGEGTLCVKNEKGLGVVADVFGLTAST